ncbi:MAG: hypothetical protein CME70_05855 [Halobacteriovorax sp.]|nr:hypothetical protein [Halobacteriovorax sp.]
MKKSVDFTPISVILIPMTIENQYGLRLSLCIEEVMNRLERSGACEEDNPWNETFASLSVLLSIVQKEEDDEECEEGHDYY